MKIKQETRSIGNDFAADMECEHCGSTQRLTTGYNNGYYHNNVIPTMTCASCGRRRDGSVPEVRNDTGTGHVPEAR